ncbi:MAG: asparagine synthase (glutamine-hydrolyzing), partial [Candidatus Omnitrophota bacterium]
MSGICGYINLDKKPVANPEIIKEMAKAVAHRGPDGEAFFIRGNVAFGQRELSVSGRKTTTQGLFDKERGLAIVYDGEIYESGELKEVSLHAFDKYGFRAFAKINGVFSLALWDDKEQKLILARDPLGTKPLYYGTFGNTFVFASEIKSILRHPAVKKEIDKKGMLKYFAHDYIPNPHTIFKGISKLEPGFYASLSGGRALEKNRYWNIRFDESRRKKSVTEYESDFRSMLKEAIKRRLKGDTPPGIFLSGGLDSSCIVAMMSELAPEKPLKTFSIAFKEKHFDESSDARAVAQRFKTDHRELTVGVREMLDVLPDVLALLDEPFADYSIIPTYCVSKFAREHVRVCLGGDGGDEFLGGYQSYTAHKISRILRFVPFSTGLLSAASKVAGGKSSYMSTGFKLRRYVRGMNYPEAIRHQVWIGSFPPNEQVNLLSGDFKGFLKDEVLYEESYRYMEEMKGLNYLNRINYLYAKTYLTDDGIPKVDKASMAAGLLVREPFLDRDFIEFATSIPVNLK